MIDRATRARLLALVAACCGIALTLGGCQTQVLQETGGETHFLTFCDDDASACGTELACRSNVCTLACDANSECDALPNAACVSEMGASAPGICDVLCTRDADCASLSSGHHCDEGSCRAGTPPNAEPGTGGSGGETGSGGDGGGGASSALDGGSNACVKNEVDPNEVVILGDSFFAVTHQITAYLEDLARAGGAIEVGERYRDQSSLLDNALGDGGIERQYTSAVAEGAVRVVIMNGGGADAVFGTCDAPTSECPALNDAAFATSTLFEQMATDGVQDVVYVGYPDPQDPAVREKMDVLRPELEAACVASPVPCHWVDLRDAFAGRYDEYTSDGQNPTALGAEAAAKEIWARLERECIAQ